MKKLFIILSMVLFSTSIFAQSSMYSIGLVGSHFHNDSNSNRISEAENPFGYGLIVSRKITNEFSVAFTGEYLQDNFENGDGEEKDIRLHLSGVLHPFNLKSVQPYFSAGFVYTHRMFEYNASSKSDDTDNTISARFSLGASVPIVNNLALVGDLGAYTDGYGYIGWGSNLGFRIGL